MFLFLFEQAVCIEGYVRDLKNLRTSYFLLSLRDLCVRWSFGRCFGVKNLGFLSGYLHPLVDCRIADLVCMRHPEGFLIAAFGINPIRLVGEPLLLFPSLLRAKGAFGLIVKELAILTWCHQTPVTSDAHSHDVSGNPSVIQKVLFKGHSALLSVQLGFDFTHTKPYVQVGNALI
jgi:hypothetical protein